jgi:hypothetical protein
MELACVTAAGRGATDRLLAAVAGRLSAEGVRLAGALRAAATDGVAGGCDSALRLLPDGPVLGITQDLGTGSAACRMDAGALEMAVARATAQLDAGEAQLVLVNKFGITEAEGRGFRSLIAEALGRGLPVLLGVSETHRAALGRFAGDGLETLPPDKEAVLDWCRAAVAGAGPVLWRDARARPHARTMRHDPRPACTEPEEEHPMTRPRGETARARPCAMTGPHPDEAEA